MSLVFQKLLLRISSICKYFFLTTKILFKYKYEETVYLITSNKTIALVFEGLILIWLTLMSIKKNKKKETSYIELTKYMEPCSFKQTRYLALTTLLF